jgi:hypothetical protein
MNKVMTTLAIGFSPMLADTVFLTDRVAGERGGYPLENHVLLRPDKTKPVITSGSTISPDVYCVIPSGWSASPEGVAQLKDHAMRIVREPRSGYPSIVTTPGLPRA